MQHTPPLPVVVVVKAVRGSQEEKFWGKSLEEKVGMQNGMCIPFLPAPCPSIFFIQTDYYSRCKTRTSHKEPRGLQNKQLGEKAGVLL